MYKNQKIAVVIPAAGSGRRMGTNEIKTFLKLRGRDLIEWTILPFATCGWVDQIIVVGRKQEEERFGTLLGKIRTELLDKAMDCPEMSFVVGGADRLESVDNGLHQLMDDINFVMVHDGARPLVSEEVIERCLEDVFEHNTSVVCVPVKDTIKVATDDHFVDSTPDRSRLFAIQTPQCFERNLLLRAYEQGKIQGLTVTDDSGLVEAFGHPVKLTLGSYNNIKVTTPEDLLLADQIMAALEAEDKQ